MTDNFLANMSQDARDAFFAAANRNITETGSYVSDAGDTMTGILNGVGLVQTGAATLTSVRASGLIQGFGAVLGSTVSIAIANIASDIATAEGAVIAKTAIGGATVAPLRLVASTASAAFLSFSGVFISSASYTAASTNAFVIPVYHESHRVWGYVGAYKALV